MSLKIKCHSKLNVPQNEKSLKMERHANKMSLKMELHAKWNNTRNGMSLKIK